MICELFALPCMDQALFLVHADGWRIVHDAIVFRLH
jgi:hypothetical protein